MLFLANLLKNILITYITMGPYTVNAVLNAVMFDEHMSCSTMYNDSLFPNSQQVVFSQFNAICTALVHNFELVSTKM